MSRHPGVAMKATSEFTMFFAAGQPLLITLTTMTQTAEQTRLDESRSMSAPWRLWGPYVSDRQWGTVSGRLQLWRR